jgi:hypothetical protein
MMTAHSRLTLTRRVSPKLRGMVLDRWKEMEVSALALQLLETVNQKINRKPCQPGSRKVHVSCNWRNSHKASDPFTTLPGFTEFFEESAAAARNAGGHGAIVLDDPTNIQILSKGVSFDGRRWHAGDFGFFQTARDQRVCLGRVQHFLHVPQRDCNCLDDLVMVYVDTFRVMGKAPNLNLVYCMKRKCIGARYVNMVDFATLAVVAPHWTDGTLACALMVDPVLQL